MIRLRNYLEQKDLWSSAKEEEQLAVAATTVSQVVKNAEEIDAPTANDFFDFMYTELPPQLQKQRQTLRTSSIGQDPSQIEQTTQEGVAH
jgi:pyruvate dehydrogenase E1 component alpha subunit